MWQCIIAIVSIKYILEIWSYLILESSIFSSIIIVDSYLLVYSIS